jgi:hypothetical protein
MLLLEVLGEIASTGVSQIPQCTDPLPIENEFCTTLFECDMGKFCCPNDDTKCVPERSCYCNEESLVVVCYDLDLPIVCPSLCPLKIPETDDYCTLDSRYQCNYGNPIDCKNANSTFDFERQCTCYNNSFLCIDNVCPVPCPTIQPKHGDKCSPYTPGNCDYGQICCPGEGGMCIPAKTCVCDDFSVNCFETSDSIPCPSSCPKAPPNDMDSCDIDSHFQCNYGDSLVCDDMSDIPSYDSEKECTCSDGKFTCYDNACPTECPEFQPTQGASCSPFYSHYCHYGEFCCPLSEGFNCVPRKVCYCDYDLKISCYEPTLMCPSLCPDKKPKAGQSCKIKSRITCSYDEEDCLIECSCINGVFGCKQSCSEVGFPTSISTNEGVNAQTNKPFSQILSFPSSTPYVSSEWNDPACPKYLSKETEQCTMADNIWCAYNEGNCPFWVCECQQSKFICDEFCDGSSAPISMKGDVDENDDENVDPMEDIPFGKKPNKKRNGKKILKEKSNKVKKKKRLKRR